MLVFGEKFVTKQNMVSLESVSFYAINTHLRFSYSYGFISFGK